jgi:hypothetical protein
MKKNLTTCLAAATLVSAASVASAQFALVANGSGADPFNMATPGHPGIADLDNDGDYDLIMHYQPGTSGNLRYFRNTGSSTAPAFSSATLSPITTTDPGGDGGKCAMGDIGGDGDFDLFVGTYTGGVLYYANNGSVGVPNFAASTQVPGTGSQFRTAPALVDIDGDGDLDLFVGGYYGGAQYYRNNGGTFASATAPAGLPGTSGGNTNSSIGFIDADGDGDYDAIYGTAALSAFQYYENTGTTVAASFTQRTGGANPFNGISVGPGVQGTAVDIDGDSDIDVVVSFATGLTWIQNTTPQQTSASPVWSEVE